MTAGLAAEAMATLDKSFALAIIVDQLCCSQPVLILYSRPLSYSLSIASNLVAGYR